MVNALNVIFNKPTSVFLTTKVKDLLFDGIIVNCTVTDFAAKAVCTQLKTEARDLKHITPTEFSFSILGPVSSLLSTHRDRYGKASIFCMWCEIGRSNIQAKAKLQFWLQYLTLFFSEKCYIR